MSVASSKSFYRPALLALGYALLLAYGSLFPFEAKDGAVDTLAFLGHWNLAALSLPDLIVNALVYIPLGLLIRWSLVPVGTFASMAVALLCGAALSFGIEATQAHLVLRVPSLADFLLNTAGTVAGAWLGGFFVIGSRWLDTLLRWRAASFRAGARADLAIVAALGWAVAQLSPFVPSLDVDALQAGLAPVSAVLADLPSFRFDRFFEYLLSVFALVLLLRDVRVRGVRLGRMLLIALMAIMIMKVLIVSRALSLEALTGGIIGLALARHLPRALRAVRPALVLAAIVSGQILGELSPEVGAIRPLNWIPFEALLAAPMRGLGVILDSIWPALVFALALARLLPRTGLGRASAVVATGAFFFLLEWLQQGIAGRTGDVTTCVIAMLTAWLAMRHLATELASDPALRPAPATLRMGVSMACVAVVGVAMMLWSLQRTPPMYLLSSDDKPMLPAADALPPATLVNWQPVHPRLPHPSAAELTRMSLEAPEDVARILRAARKGAGDFESVILAELLNPGSQDLRQLVSRLLELKMTWRGHNQTKPIAKAYDWLYDRLPADLRPALREKLLEACEYQVSVIRKDRLSPYNVYLYNAPLQALMACAIAAYQDDPRADPVMAFTADYWRERVLPVWRQIGGQQGGWHEGIEYVGIGIGQAIYQLPAMWRAATGEDYFAEPAIRGFLDFVLHRQRPDGSALRWGDGRFPQRGVPDAAALAIEYRHPQAYRAFVGESPSLLPTAWPWGPLPDESIASAPAAPLALTHVADGLGWVMARSNWEAEATLFSFKAGDNYWSHSHLDQGAFTIFKGSALAIDSGCYCGYGEAHHLNYQYQSIAHNTLTVTDPDDNVLMPQRNGKPPRPIANDGGQRRVGSGWNLHAAPLDLADWQKDYEEFHTGRLVRMVDQGGVMVALADITAAYTNARSGERRFHQRTRRVEKAWRIFVYDRTSDVIVVYDDIASSSARFRKRWLLHSAEAPLIEGRRFLIRRPVGASGQGMSQLEGEVLFPTSAMLTTIGGDGFEFFVDGNNFADDKVMKRINGERDQIDAGRWRMEVSPNEQATNDRFLVVMRPSLQLTAPLEIDRQVSGDVIGADIRLPGRTLSVRFPANELAVSVKVSANGEETSMEVKGEGEQAPPVPWFNTLMARLEH